MQETGNNKNTILLKSIRFTSDGFYLFGDSQESSFEKVKNILQKTEDELFSLISKKVNPDENISIYFPSSCFTVIPSILFQHERIRDILTFDQGQLPAHHVILNEKNPNMDYTILYTIPLSIFNSIKSNYKNSTFHFLSASFQTKTRDGIQIWVNEEHSTFKVMNDKKLLLFNNLTARTEEDILFYILKIAEDFNFNISELQIDIFQPNQLLREEVFHPFLTNCNFIAQESQL